MADREEDRYASAAGWDGSDRVDPEEKKRIERIKEKFLKQHERNVFINEALEVAGASDAFRHTADENARPRPLFGDMFREGELAILFSDTGLGKSILAVQIADAISRGSHAIEKGKVRTDKSKSSPPYEGGVDAVSADGVVLSAATEPRKVLYVDFELSDAQFAERYSVTFKNGRYYGKHKFNDEFFQRSKINLDADVPEHIGSISAAYGNAVIRQVEIHRPEVVIIDNITYISDNVSSHAPALRLMKSLQNFKRIEGISILVLAHTTKCPYAHTLTENDLAGAKSISNFADTLFAIGRSRRGGDIRYIKHIKARGTGNQHSADNVITARIVKKRGFLHFAFDNTAPEHHHLTVHGAGGEGESGSPTYKTGAPAGASPRGVDIGGVDAASADGVVLSSRTRTNGVVDPPDLKNPKIRARMIKKTKRLHAQGHSNHAIAKLLGIAVSTVARYLKKR